MKLDAIYFFSALSPEQLERIATISLNKTLQPGEFLFFEGDQPKYLHMLLEGVVKVYKSLPDGNEIVIHNFTAPTMVAEMPCLEHIRYPATAVCETVCQVMLIDYARFEKEFLADPAISFNIIRSLTKKIKNLDAAFTAQTTLSASQRVARFIQEHPETFLQLKNKKIAEILNITPETLSRILKKLKDAGALGSGGGKTARIDGRKLAAFC